MKKSTKSLLIISTILLEIYGFLWIATTIISFVPQLVTVAEGSMLYSFNQFFEGIAQSVRIDNGIVMKCILMLLPAILYQVYSALLMSQYKGSNKKYIVVSILSILLLVMTSVVGSLAIQIFGTAAGWLNILYVCLPAVVIIALLVVAVIVLIRQPPVATAPIVADIEEQPDQEQPDQEEAPQPDEQVAPVITVATQYQPRELESTRDIVNNTYGKGAESFFVPAHIQRQLDRLQKLYQLGAITKYEYDQLKARILTDRD